MSRETPHRQEQQQCRLNIPSGALGDLTLDAPSTSGSRSNQTTAHRPMSPVVPNLKIGDEVFLIDTLGSSISCSSARFSQLDWFGPEGINKDRPEKQEDNIFCIISIGESPQANGEIGVTYGIHAASGRLTTRHVRTGNLHPIGSKPGLSLLVRKLHDNDLDSLRLDDVETTERRYSLLVKAAWVSSWERMYRVVNRARGTEMVISESILTAMSLP